MTRTQSASKSDTDWIWRSDLFANAREERMTTPSETSPQAGWRPLWALRKAAQRQGFTLVLWVLALFVMGVLAGVPAFAAPFGYVTNTYTGTVLVIDAATNAVVTTLPVGPGATGVAITPDGAHAYVTNSSNKSVSVIATATNTVVATIAVGWSPQAVAIPADGAHAYVSNSGDSTVSVIATATNTVSATIPVGAFPTGIAVSPDGRHVYTANSYDDTVSVVDTVSNSVLPIPVGPWPCSVAVTPDGTHAYVLNSDSDTVSVIDTVTNAVVAEVGAGSGAVGVAVSPDGAHAYVANWFGNNVSVIATATNSLVATIPVGGGPVGVGFTPDGAKAYVTNEHDGTLSVIDTATNSVVATIPMGAAGLYDIAFTPILPSSGSACDGTYNGTLHGDITVSAGQNCNWMGGEITGKVVVTGGTFATTNSIIAGNVTIGGAGTFSLGAGTTIDGNLGIGLTAPGTTTNQVCGTNVLHNVSVEGEAGALQFGSASPTTCAGNTIGGNVTIDVSDGPISVYNNSIGSNLSCQAGGSITGDGNTAKHKLGQCAAF